MKNPLIAFSVVAILAGATVHADDTANAEREQARLNKRLHGDYSAISHEFCASSASDFGPAPNFQAFGPISNSSSTSQSVQTFHGDGTFSSTSHSLVTSTPTSDGSPVFPAAENQFTCTGTYQVHADDTFDLTTTCAGTQVAGRFAGLLRFTSGETHETGRIVGKTVQFAHVQAEVRSTDVRIGPTFQTTSFAICSGESTSHKIPLRDTQREADNSDDQ